MQTFYPPLRKRAGIDDSAGQSPANGHEGSNVQEGLPRRGHSGLVIQAAAKAAASGTAASYCNPGLWLGHRHAQAQALTPQKAPTGPTAPRASRSSSHPIGDSLDVTFQERLTSFGADQLPELVELIEAKHSQFSPVSLCTAIHRLAAFQQGSKQFQRCQGLLSTLESQLRERPSRFRAQSHRQRLLGRGQASLDCPVIDGGNDSDHRTTSEPFQTSRAVLVFVGHCLISDCPKKMLKPQLQQQLHRSSFSVEAPSLMLRALRLWLTRQACCLSQMKRFGPPWMQARPTECQNSAIGSWQTLSGALPPLPTRTVLPYSLELQRKPRLPSWHRST